MATSTDLLAAVGSRPPLRWSGTGYRHAAHHYPPLSGEGARKLGGRWNPPASFPVLYLADSPATCEAEFRRLAALQGRQPRDFLPRALHQIECDGLPLLDLRSSTARAAVGLTDADLHSDDRSRCQTVGEAAEFLGFAGVLAPSAADRPDGLVIAVFVDRAPSGSLEVASTTEFEVG